MIEVGLILLLSVISVVLITSEGRTKAEEKLMNGINRIWYVPPALLLILSLLSVVSLDTIIETAITKIDILLLVLSLTFVSEGMKTSGLFEMLGSKVPKRISTRRQLIVYVILLTALVTILTSNDIVIIALTPITYQLCVNSGLQDARLVLMTQFIVANTMSMATYIGSPTNIIVSEELGINFIEYLYYMILPSLASLASIFVSVSVYARITGIELNQKIQTKSPSKDTSLEIDRMVGWSLIFLLAVVLVALSTLYSFGLIPCTVAIMSISIYYSISNNESVVEKLSSIPLELLVFGLVFFTVGESFVSTNFATEFLVPTMDSMIRSNIVYSSLVGIIGSGILVNIFNDLPAAAIVAPLLEELSISPRSDRILIVQSLLIGLNIGKYVTKVGSLAGVIWFSILDSEEGNLETPSSVQLLKFGLLSFVINCVLCFLVINLQYWIVS